MHKGQYVTARLLICLSSLHAENLAHYWHSERCTQFYASRRPAGAAATLPVTVTGAATPLRVRAELTTTAEDMCAVGRNIVTPMNNVPATEVVLIPSLELAYIEMRKCGSETIRELLHHVFNATYLTCGLGPVPADCSKWDHRCTTYCLSHALANQYFFFTFVRHPIARFYSAYRQAHYGNKIEGVHISLQELLEQLRAIEACEPRDQHLESMATGLSSSLHPAIEPASRAGQASTRAVTGGMVPMDYIGELEHLEQDFFEMLVQSGRLRKLNDATIDRLRFRLGRHYHEHNASAALHGLASNAAGSPQQRAAERSVDTSPAGTNGREQQLAVVRMEDIDRIVRRVYAQDFACFGYV